MTKEEQETAEMDCLRCYNQGYEKGKEDTIEKAWEYIKAMIDYALNGGDITHITKDCVTKAMEE